MNNGTGTMIAKMYMDEQGKVIPCSIQADDSIGMHEHETSDDINYVLSGKGNYRIGSRNIAYRVTCYEDNSLEKGTLSVSKKHGLHLIMKYGIHKIYWKKK